MNFWELIDGLSYIGTFISIILIIMFFVIEYLNQFPNKPSRDCADLRRDQE